MPQTMKDVARTKGGLRFFRADRLDEAQMQRWREFAAQVPWANHLQDPAWAHVEAGASGASRKPSFFWAELDGGILLTALGVRRALPVPGRAFWEFKKGPTILDATHLYDWLAWLSQELRHDVARLHVEPPIPLAEGGDDVETTFDRSGFVRRRGMGTWATLLVDLDRDEDQIMGSFRPRTRTQVRKCAASGIEVDAEDTPEGWAVLSRLDAEMALRADVRPIGLETVARISSCWLAGGAGGTLLVARHDGEPVAAALVVVYRDRAHLSVIPSSRRHGKLSASHLLVWEAMRWARRRGCRTFDFEGYSMMAQPGDALWGINQFKRGFAPGVEPSKCVALHEKVFSPAIVASAGAVRRLQAWRRRSSGTSGA